MKNNQGMIPIVGTIPYGNSLVTFIPQGFGRNYESRYPNPNAYLSEKEDAKYCLHYAKAFFTDCVQNGIAARTHQQFVMRRLYARGEQGVGKYNYKFSEGGTYNSVTINDMRARVLATMPQDNIKLIKAKLATMRGMLVPDKINPQAKVNDPEALFIKSKNIAMIKGGYQTLIGDQMLTAISQDIGKPLLPPNIMQKVKNGEIQSEDDLDVAIENFSLDVESAMSRTLDGILYQINNWRIISNELIERLQIDGIAWQRVYQDYAGRAMIRTCDNVNMLYKIPLKKDTTDVEAVGELMLMSISDLKNLKGAERYTLKQWEELMTTITGTGTGMGNPVSTQKVCVLDMEWKETINLEFKKYTNRKGYESLKVLDRTGYESPADEQGKEPNSNTKKEQRVTKVAEVVFQAIWVIGTDFIFNYGIKPSQYRGNKSSQYAEANLSFVGYSMTSGDSTNSIIDSMVGDIISLIDEYETKRRSLLAEIAGAPKSIRAYNERVLSVMKDQLKLQNVTQVIEVLEGMRRAILPQDVANSILQGQAKSILVQDEPSGIDYNLLNYYLSEMQRIIRDISDIMGIPIGYDGQNADPNMPVSTQKIMGGAISARLNDYKIALDSITKRVLERAGKCAQYVIGQYKKGQFDYNPYANLLPDAQEDILALLDRISEGDYIFEYSATMPIEDKETLNMMLNSALSAGTLTADEFFLIQHKVNGNPLELSRELAKMRKKREEMQLKSNEEIQKINQEGNLKAAQEAAAARAEEERLKHEREMEILELKHKLEMDKLAFERETQLLITKNNNRTTIEKAEITEEKKEENEEK